MDDGGWWMIMADGDGDGDDDDDDEDDDDDGVVVGGDDDAWNQYWWNLLGDGSLTPAHAPLACFSEGTVWVESSSCWESWSKPWLWMVHMFKSLDIETTCFLTIFWSDPEGLDPAYVELAFPIHSLQGIP